MNSTETSRTIFSAEEVWKEDEHSELVFLRTAIVAFKGDTAYHGTTTARKKDIDKETVLKELSPIPREDIYPQFSPHLTRAPEVYIKIPNLSLYSPGSKLDISALLLHEAEIYEILREHPHPTLGRSLGSVVSEDGRITGLALVKYDSTMFERSFDPLSFGEEQANRCMEALEAGVQHLHSLGLAHNDLSPLNVMFSDEGEPVLIDFDTCHPIGTTLTKGGCVGEWEDGIPVAVYENSSTECDKAALEHMRMWLKKKYDGMQPENDTTIWEAKESDIKNAVDTPVTPSVSHS
ncbi:hypothetical protein N7527_012147 [Penicillium freii]|nr:hypothetical protein N7527_012147 [Penicillium freii]